MRPFPDFDIEAAARRINEGNRRENARIAARRVAAREEARKIASALRVADTTITGIWGFGSVFESSRAFRMDSDIDLAIEGGNILKLSSLAEDSIFKVDLIDITGCDDAFARLVREGGTRL